MTYPVCRGIVRIDGSVYKVLRVLRIKNHKRRIEASTRYYSHTEWAELQRENHVRDVRKLKSLRL